MPLAPSEQGKKRIELIRTFMDIIDSEIAMTAENSTVRITFKQYDYTETELKFIKESYERVGWDVTIDDKGRPYSPWIHSIILKKE